MNGFPSNWLVTALSDISIIQMGQSPSSRSYNDVGEGLPFFQGKAEFGKLYPTVRKWCTEPQKIAEAEDILLSVRAPVGPTNLASEKCCIGRGLAAIRAEKQINQKYLLHYFRNIEPWLMQQGTGTTFKAISGSFIRDIDVPIAPLNEQKRIADKLDTLLARVDASRAHLERVQAILKDFRQSVLAAAVSGRLTEEWREKNNSECVFLQSPQMTEYNDSLLPDLPNSWEWQRFGNVATIESNLVDPQKYQNYPHIAPNYIESQTGRLLAYGTVASDNIISANHLFRPGQIIYSKIRPYLCKAVIVNFSGLCSADMYPISGKLVSSEYLHKWLISQQFTLFASSKQGRTVLPKINQKALNEIPVPIPPAKEQQEIVRRVEVLFDYADRLETQTQAALDRVDNLTPSLLAKAFRGELVEQDPNDEPASVLLARIRAERAQQPKLDVKKRVTKKVKMTENSVKEMIQKLPQDTFSFDELREMLPGNYDELKNILFKLLAEPNPSIMQVFDTNLQAIRFVRSAK